MLEQVVQVELVTLEVTENQGTGHRCTLHQDQPLCEEVEVGKGWWMGLVIFPKPCPVQAELRQSWVLWGGEGWDEASRFGSVQCPGAALCICSCVHQWWLSST